MKLILGQFSLYFIHESHEPQSVLGSFMLQIFSPRLFSPRQIFSPRCAFTVSHFSPVPLFEALGLWPPRLHCPWDSSGKNTGTGYHQAPPGNS